MGMFDEIECEFDIKPSSAKALTFQTKDTPDQMLAKYKITRSGFLAKQVNDKWLVCEYTGPINFYACYENNGRWIEFAADFKDGKTDSIRKVEGD